jgi:hypothetical protein
MKNQQNLHPTRLIPRNRLQGLSAIIAGSLLLVLVSWKAGLGVPGATLWVLLWAGFESVIAFCSLSWSLPRSNRAFFSFFVGGSLFRLLSLGVVAWILVAVKAPPAVPLLALVCAYFLLSLVQLPFLTHELR